MNKMLHRFKEQKDLTGVLIGLGDGTTALELLEQLDLEVLMLVDDSGAAEHTDESEPTEIEAAAMALLSDYKHVIIFLRADAKKAASYIDEGTVDFVLVDANAEVASSCDLGVWCSKLVQGNGVMAGNGYESLSLETVTDVPKEIRETVLPYSFVPAGGDEWGLLAPPPSAEVKCLIAGPYAGELGYELMVWIPAIRYLAENYQKVTVVVPKGREALYADFADKIISHNISFGANTYKFNTRELSFWHTSAWDEEAGDNTELKEQVQELHAELCSMTGDIVEPGPWLLTAEKKYVEY